MMKYTTTTKLSCFLFLLSIFTVRINGQVSVTGEIRKWHTVIFTFEGPHCSENDFRPNPFLDYRLEVTFRHNSKVVKVPGYFAADGNASETGAVEGNKWRVNFVPDDTGAWSYKVSFRTGRNIAIGDNPDDGNPVAQDGLEGSIKVMPSDKLSPDFRSKGRLSYTGERYLKFQENGEYFMKGGADSPENFLAFHEFDNTPPKHQYEAHKKDWHEGDPVWNGSKGKGIIGAVNYLASKKVNSIYFLLMNIQGDGNDVFPWTDPDERYRFDCSKLDQWDIVFCHMEKLGVMMHVVLSENENQLLLDAGFLKTQRKLFYREMIARYGHHLAVTWNLGEENGPASWYDFLGQSVGQRKACLEYLKKTNPYNSFVCVHTLPDDPERKNLLAPFLGFPYIDGASLQISKTEKAAGVVSWWVNASADSGRQWVVNYDEVGPYNIGVLSDEKDPAHDTIRRNALWPVLMAGGAGVEWYAGPKDLTVEDFSKWEQMWLQTGIAVDFFKQNLPFWRMTNQNSLISGTGNHCFALPGEIYAVYLPNGGNTNINLPEGKFSVRWFNPRAGGDLIKQGIVTLKGSGWKETGNPPSDPEKDWVLLIRKI